MKLAIRTLAVMTLIMCSDTVDAQTKPAPPAKQPVNIEQGIDQMFAALDKDKNKQLSYDEFKNGVVAERKQAMLMQRLGGIFKQADKNGNEHLEVSEFNTLPGISAMKDPKPKLADFDANKDLKLSFREYLSFVQSMNQAPRK